MNGLVESMFRQVARPLRTVGNIMVVHGEIECETKSCRMRRLECRQGVFVCGFVRVEGGRRVLVVGLVLRKLRKIPVVITSPDVA